MISSNLKEHKGLKIEGNIREVSAECILIMREIFKKNMETYGKEIAMGILTNMLISAIEEDLKNEENV